MIWDSTIGSWRLRLREEPPPVLAGEAPAIEVSSLSGTMPFIFSRTLLGKNLAMFAMNDSHLIVVCARQPQDGAALSDSATRYSTRHTRIWEPYHSNSLCRLGPNQRISWSEAPVDPMSAYLCSTVRPSRTDTYIVHHLPSVSSTLFSHDIATS